MSNYHFKDKHLSLKAKGLLSLMLSLPEDWDYTVAGLATLSSDGDTAVRTGLKELEKRGYLYRKRVYTNGKVSDIEYHIFENVDDYNKFIESLRCGNIIQENIRQENKAQLNTNNNKNTKEDKNTKSVRQKPLVSCNSSSNTVQDIVDCYNEVCNELPKVRSVTPKRKQAVLTILKKYGKDTIKEVFSLTAGSDFLLGKTGGTWNATFDWLFKESNFVKVLEGNYKSSYKKGIKSRASEQDVISQRYTEDDKIRERRIKEKLQKEGLTNGY